MKKINWGVGVIIAFALFMVFILYFVFKVQSNPNYDNELVVNDYYIKEAQAQADLDKMQRANDLKEKVILQLTSEGIEIKFPAEMDASKISGKVLIYRPSSEKLDIELPLTLTGSSMVIRRDKLQTGRWDVIMDWKYDTQGYLNKASFKL